MKQTEHNTPDILAYLRGELRAEEREVIERLIAQDPDFAANIEFQRILRETLQGGDAAETSSEFGWARLSKAIDAELEVNAVPAANDAPQSVRFWKYAAIVLACAVFGQTYLMVASNSDTANDKYFMAGDIQSQAKVTIKPSVTLTLSDLSSLLIENEGLITLGPDKQGKYEVSFQSLEACSATMKALRSADKSFEMTKACEQK